MSDWAEDFLNKMSREAIEDAKQLPVQVVVNGNVQNWAVPKHINERVARWIDRIASAGLQLVHSNFQWNPHTGVVTIDGMVPTKWLDAQLMN